MHFENKMGIFSPDGRLYQVEYAQHASNQGATVCLNVTGDKIHVFYENKQTSVLEVFENKIVPIGKDIYILFSGIKPDSYLVEKVCATEIYMHKMNTAQDITIRGLAGKIAKYKREFTVKMSHRPLGLKTVLFGIENGKGRIFVIESDGNFAEYEKCAVGYKSDKIYDNFKDSGKDASLSALLNVVQKNHKFIKGYEINTNEGIKEIVAEEIKTKLDEMN
ncbi:PSA7 [Enterospora canceri]|uniref:PSA7 n=1 Tax=Enterospora canceri TaxID=1081671 RepID=A0A1Y1S6R3_9MICR|nr:PSA7 [Enterospora canceri]